MSCGCLRVSDILWLSKKTKGNSFNRLRSNFKMWINQQHNDDENIGLGRRHISGCILNNISV